MKINLNKQSAQGLSRQVYDRIRELILSGELKPGDKLPSTRLLSKELQINRITVSQGYSRLSSEGLVRSDIGSGTYVAYNPAKNQGGLDQSTYNPIFFRGMHYLKHASRGDSLFSGLSPGMLNFSSLVPDERLFPVDSFRECLNHVVSRDGPKLLQYCGTMGYPPLRELIVERMKLTGVSASVDEVLMVNGSQQGLDLVLRSFLSPGDRVALALPTYHNIFPVMGYLLAEASPVPMTGGGPDLEKLKEAVRDKSVRLIYTMPDFQNPTGITSSSEHRSSMYDIASKANLPVLEDAFEKDLALDSDVPRPIKALDKDGRVIYLSTFSKSLFPGLRTGWLIAGRETIETLAALKKASDLENSALLQGAVHEFCVRGFYDAHLNKIKEVIRERMDAACEALELYMPEGASWNMPRGGYVLWIGLPRGASSERVFASAKKKGVLVSPGTLFSLQGNDPGGVRLSLSRTDVKAVREGIKTLGRVVSDELKRGDTESAPATQTPQHL